MSHDERIRPAGGKRLTRDINAETPMPDNPALTKPAAPEDYNHDRLEAGDFIDNVTDTFDDDIQLPRA